MDGHFEQIKMKWNVLSDCRQKQAEVLRSHVDDTGDKRMNRGFTNALIEHVWNVGEDVE